MFTWGSKYFFGLSALALVAAIVYAVVSGGAVIGALSLGWKGGVGDHLGYAVLLGLSLALLLLGVVAVWTRDAQAEDVALLVGSEQVPQAVPPAHPSYWGGVAAFAVGCLVIGASVSSMFLLVGIVLLAVVGLEWAVLNWTDRATGDPAANRTLRNRLMLPIEIPLFGALGIAVFALGVSRVLLAVSAGAAVVVATVIATLAFAMAVAFVYRPGWFSQRTVSALVAGFAVVVLAGGVVAAAVGPREFEHHGEGHAEEGHEDEGEGELEGNPGLPGAAGEGAEAGEGAGTGGSAEEHVEEGS